MHLIRTTLLALTVCLIFLGIHVTRQVHTTPAVNERPLVSNVRATVDESSNQVIITYDVSDTEDEDLDIALTISADGGTTFLYPVDAVTGDVGFPVTPGADRQVSWTYDSELVRLSNPQTGFIAQIVADDRYQIPIEDLVSQVDSSRIKADLQQRFERIRHYDTGFDAIEDTKNYLEETFEAHGLQASRQPFTFSGWNAANIIGRHPGLTDEAAVYIVDAHFDTVSNTPGTDDNGSGTAGVLEAARVLSHYQFEKSIKFIGFDLEEVGLRGSERYVQDGIPAYERTEGVINLEMISYTCFTAGCDAFASIGNYITSVYNNNTQDLRRTFANAGATYVPDLRIISVFANPSNPNFRRSDHARFWDAGIPALFVNDNANFRNNNYHQPTDQYDTIDLEFTTNVVKTTVATLAEMAGLQHSGVGRSPAFEIKISTSQEPVDDIPDAIVLAQNYPNPFLPPTTISYTLTEPGDVTLKVYNIIGQEVDLLVQASQLAGEHTISWDGRDHRGQRLASGVYLYRLYVSDQIKTRTMILLE